MSVNAPVSVYSGTMDVDEFMTLLQTRPDGERWDLIEGVAVMMAPPSAAHQPIVVKPFPLLKGAFGTNPDGPFPFPGVGGSAPGVRDFPPQPDVVVRPGIAGYDLYFEDFR